MGPMSFSFLNSGTLFYKFFFFNFLGASSNGLPRFKTELTMVTMESSLNFYTGKKKPKKNTFYLLNTQIYKIL